MYAIRSYYDTAYFDGHATHSSTSGHDVAYDNGVLDQTDSGKACNVCHNPISTWSEVTALHNYNSCDTCHGYNGSNSYNFV